MPIFVPFGFRGGGAEYIAGVTPAPAPSAPAPAPAPSGGGDASTIFGGILNYWRADTNVTTLAGSVTSWTDSVGGVVLNELQGTAPIQRDSTDLNNQPSIYFNGGGLKSADNAGMADLTPFTTADKSHRIYIVAKTFSETDGAIFGPAAWKPSYNYDAVTYDINTRGTTDFRIWGVGIADFSQTGDPLQSNVSSIQDIRVIAFGTDYSGVPFRVAGSYNKLTLNHTATPTDGMDDYEPINSKLLLTGRPTYMGFTVGYTTRYIETEICEVVVIDGVPTADEISNYSTYLSNRYNLSYT